MKFIFSFLLVVVSISTLISQILTHKKVPFINHQNHELKYPLTGGLNSIQVNEIDLNQDGVMDLVLFDRVGHVFVPMIYNAQTQDYEYEPQYKHIFPRLKDWVIFKDYNKDGLADIFSSSFNTEGIPGIEVHTASKSSGELSFEKFDAGQFFKVLYFPIGSAKSQIPVDYSDLPSIDDVDGDGDLDIVLFEPGNNRASLFLNVSIERGYGLDTLAFIFGKRCYGGFIEEGQSSNIILSRSQDSCAEFWTPIITSRHAGSTILSTDLNGDGLSDVLIGDLLNPKISALYNSGSKSNAYMSSKSQNWPGGADSVNFVQFLGAFAVDVDRDNLKDIVISSNDPGRSENINNLWYYRNTGTASSPDYKLQTKSLFVSDMIDLGAGSDPCFVDYNQDGLMDILVGIEGFFIVGSSKRDARLVLFENVGTRKFPKYKLVDSNYLNFQEFALGPDPHDSFSPSFGDLDNDGDLDLLVGENYGQFFYCENIAGKGNPFIFKKPVYAYQDLSTLAFSSPVIVDLNRDGLSDIVSGAWLNTNDVNGNACGSFYYFQNTGTVGFPKFDLDYYKSPNTNCLGNIRINGIGSKSFTSPEIVDFNGTYKMFSGNIYGEVKIISNIENNITGTFLLENANYGQLLDGERSRISLADIDDDGILDMVTGNSRGGLSMFQTTIKVDGTTQLDYVHEERIKVFPNPSEGEIYFINRDDVPFYISIHTSEGQKLDNFYLESNSSKNRNFHSIPDGLYIITMQNKKSRSFIKWIKM
jgi:hypothetical protein